MSKLPQLNLRIPEQFHGLVRDIAQRLRERDGADFGARLTYFLHDQPAPTDSGDPALAMRVSDLEARLDDLAAESARAISALSDALQAARASHELTQRSAMAANSAAEIPPRKNEPFSDAVLMEADRLNASGMKWEDVWLRLDRPGTVNGLRNAVKKWRTKQDQEWATSLDKS